MNCFRTPAGGNPPARMALIACALSFATGLLPAGQAARANPLPPECAGLCSADELLSRAALRTLIHDHRVGSGISAAVIEPMPNRAMSDDACRGTAVSNMDQAS